MSAVVPLCVSPSVPATTAGKVQVLTDFFGSRLLLKRYRKDKRDETIPSSVYDCETAFGNLATSAVALVEGGVPLDAVHWADICSNFSAQWIECCHWVSPRKLREFFSTNLGAQWTRVDEVPASKEQPPVDLKWYKSLEGSNPVQPCMCPLCNVVCNSKAQYAAHAQGRTHKTLARAYAKKHGCSTDIAPTPMSRSNSKSEGGESCESSEGCSPSESSLEAVSPPSPAASTPSPVIAPNVQIPSAYAQPMYLHPTNSFNESPMAVRTTISAVSYQTAVSSSVADQSAADAFSCADSACVTPLMQSLSSLNIKPDIHPEVSELLGRVCFELAALQDVDASDATDDRIAHTISLAQPLLTGDAGDVLVDAVFESSLRSEQPHVTKLCAQLMQSSDAVRRQVEQAVAEMVAKGFGETQPELGLLEQTYAECHFSTTYDCTLDMVARHKAKGLVRFVSGLVAEGLLPEALLVQMAARTVETPSPDALHAVLSAVRGSLHTLSLSTIADVRMHAEAALAAHWYPTRVHALAASI